MHEASDTARRIIMTVARCMLESEGGGSDVGSREDVSSEIFSVVYEKAGLTLRRVGRCDE